MSNIKDLSYEILETSDGSPTLLLPESQPMHSLQGAFSETMEIYGPVTEKAFHIESPRFLSLGLGLGYNEIMTATMAVNLAKTDWSLDSFEALPQLNQYFKAWVDHEDSPLNDCYDRILKMFNHEYSVDPLQVKTQLKNVLLHPALDSQNKTKHRYQAIYYDAFSSTTDPQLWTSNHLDSFFKNHCAEECYLSTYASTGALKRTLKENGFEVKTKKGFGKKRESIFASK